MDAPEVSTGKARIVCDQTVTLKAASRNPKCARCRNHSVMNSLKGHKHCCPWRNCTCDRCQVVIERQKVTALRVANLRQQRKVSESYRKKLSMSLQYDWESRQKRGTYSEPGNLQRAEAMDMMSSSLSDEDSSSNHVRGTRSVDWSCRDDRMVHWSIRKEFSRRWRSERRTPPTPSRLSPTPHFITSQPPTVAARFCAQGHTADVMDTQFCPNTRPFRDHSDIPHCWECKPRSLLAPARGAVVHDSPWRIPAPNPLDILVDIFPDCDRHVLVCAMKDANGSISQALERVLASLSGRKPSPSSYYVEHRRPVICRSISCSCSGKKPPGYQALSDDAVALENKLYGAFARFSRDEPVCCNECKCY